MKRTACLIVTISAAFLLTGCVGLSVGGGSKTQPQQATIGQQLIDLQNARNAGALSEAEYQAQRARLLRER